MKQNKGRKTQELQKRNKERKKKEKNIVEKKEEKSMKARRNKKRNETVCCNGWPAADVRVIATTERTTVNERWEKGGKPGGANYFLREKHEVFSNKNCKKEKTIQKQNRSVQVFVLFFESKEHENPKKGFE